MYLKDINSNLIKEIITSFELSYESICNGNIAESKLLSILKPEDKGWVRFYFEDYQNSYLPDTDDTFLFYIALLKINYEKYRENALQIIKDCRSKRTPSGLVATWPQRSLERKEQTDSVVNLHFIWLCHILKIEEQSIENHLLNWLDYEDITTSYYHNERFILFSCLKAANDFNDSPFKSKFIEKVHKRINQRNLMIPSAFKDLIFEEGVFRHIGKNVFFHFFNLDNSISDNNLCVNEKEVDGYYQLKELTYNPKKNGQEQFKKIENYDFANSDFYNMGCLRMDNGAVVKDKIALFDTTIYPEESIIKINPFVKNNSLSIRPHLNRAMGLLPSDVQLVLRKYWNHAHEYVKTAQYNVVNSFMMIQLSGVQVPEHKHKDIRSIITFVMVLGDDFIDADFVIEDEVLKFPQSKFFMISFAGYPKSHEVVKRDKNNYIYFVFDLDQPPPTQNKIMESFLLKY